MIRGIPVSRARPLFGLWGVLFSPAGITFLMCVLLAAAVIASAGGDPLELARLGSRYAPSDLAQHLSSDPQGYDGQFIYYIARTLDPVQAAAYLDAPAYRYQRILLPLAARALSLGSETALPWVLALLGVVSQTAGVWAVSRLLQGWGINRWYALVYGLWAGLLLAVRLDLPEPLAYALVAGAILANQRRRPYLGAVFYGLALFAKEVTLLFFAAQFAADLLGRRWKNLAALGLLAGLPFAVFQGWLFQVFDQPGLGSGGAMATPFEWIPFMGLLRIAEASWPYLLAMLVVFGPTIVWPSIWGLWKGVNTWRTGEENVIVFGVIINALLIAFLPFSTFREPGGLMRFATGLVLSLLLFAARYRQKRALNYSLLWLVLNVFLLK